MRWEQAKCRAKEFGRERKKVGEEKEGRRE